jgi:hypothetical protein
LAFVGHRPLADRLSVTEVFVCLSGTGITGSASYDQDRQCHPSRFVVKSVLEGNHKIMRAVALRFAIAFLTFVFGLTLNWFVNTSQLVEKALGYPVKTLDTYLGRPVEVPPRRITFDSGLRTEVMFQRVDTGCLDCRYTKVVLRTQGLGDSEEAIVTETDLLTNQEKRGRLHSYYHHNLLRFIEAQGYFDMNVPPSMTCAHESVVLLSVSIGGREKSIFVTHRADIPPALWGIHYAIEGVLTHVIWEKDK